MQRSRLISDFRLASSGLAAAAIFALGLFGTSSLAQPCAPAPLTFQGSYFRPFDTTAPTHAENFTELGSTYADLNGDGHPDLVAARFRTDNDDTSRNEYLYTVLFNRGDGSFGDEVGGVLRPAPVAGYPTLHPLEEIRDDVNIGTADVDGDGHRDIVAVVSSREANDPGIFYGSVWVLRGHGDGTFDPASYALLPLEGFQPAGMIHIADLNADSRPDILSAGAAAGYAAGVVLNNGDGTYAAPFYVPVAAFPRWVDAADLDGDGDVDFAVAVSAPGINKVSVCYNNGAGAFPTRSDWNTPQTFPQRLVLTRLDADAREDFVIQYSTSRFSKTINNGSGLPGASATHVHGVASGSFTDFVEAIGAGDIDGDGDNDVAVARYDRQLSVWLNNGSGAFTLSAGYEVDGLHFSQSRRVFVQDLNGDGLKDLATEQTAILFNRGGADGWANAFESFKRVAVGNGADLSQPAGLSTGDLDHDGDLDICGVINNTQSIVFVLKNAGAASFSQTWSATTPTAPKQTALGDVNRDGHLDMVVTSNQCCPLVSNVFVFFGNGDGTFDTPPTTYAGLGVQPEGVTIADITGDEWPDLLISGRATGFDPPAALWIAPNIGDGTFGAATEYASGPNPYLGSGGGPAVGDLDGDEVLDVAYVRWFSPTALSVRKNLGGGALGAEAVQAVPASFPSQVITADLDDDGDLDLVAAGGWITANYAGAISVYLNPGNGAFGAPANYLARPLPAVTQARELQSVVAADLDGDGDLDVAARDDSNFGVYVFINRGDGTFKDEVIPYALGADNQSLIAGDFDGDGRVDLAGASASQLREQSGKFGSVNILLNRSCLPVVCLADFNQSGERTVQDLFDYLAAWFAHCDGSNPNSPCFGRDADVNNSGAITVQDLFTFLAAWFAGCD